MTVKNEVLVRVYIVLAALAVLGAVIFAKAFQISVLQGAEWRDQGTDEYLIMREIAADRGDILAMDGSLLATSLPFFDIAFDPNSSGMSQQDWDENIDSLAYLLAEEVVDGYTPGAYKEYLVQKRREGREYIPLKKKVPYAEMARIKQFPLFNLGQMRGGFIAVPKFDRDRPFGMMARRTVGYFREPEDGGDSLYVGIEGSYNQVLRGEAGLQPMVKLNRSGTAYKPVNDLMLIQPRPGLDVKTTIDIDLQDITEQALYRTMKKHDAEYGTAIVMEVQTGAIRAIANLGKSRREGDDFWYEDYNYAVGTATEPGSTFKLASMMALLEDGHVGVYDTLDLELGRWEVYDETMQDASYHGLNETSVKTAFEISSNVGMAKLVKHFYGKDRASAERFIERMHQFRLHVPTGIEIRGEDAPYIKRAYSDDDNWSGTTLPWMAIGYETELTPLQTLTFYNAVANNGYLMQPKLVTEIQQYGETVEKFPFTRVRRRIAEEETIATAQFLLEGVVKNGTAKKHDPPHYDFAGKTGTTQLDYSRIGDRRTVGGYQASFAGYFPARNPRYSCIVLVSKPKNGFYGSEVALPVFREIADRTVAIKADLHPTLVTEGPIENHRKLPRNDAGFREDVQYVAAAFDLPVGKMTANEWTVLKPTDAHQVNLVPRTVSSSLVPDVTGMGLRDAVYLLENLGYLVEFSGVGKVKRQSIRAGTTNRGQRIKLFLG